MVEEYFEGQYVLVEENLLRKEVIFLKHRKKKIKKRWGVTVVEDKYTPHQGKYWF